MVEILVLLGPIFMRKVEESGIASRGTIYCPVEGCEKKYCKKSNLNRHMSRGARRSTARRVM